MSGRTRLYFRWDPFAGGPKIQFAYVRQDANFLGSHHCGRTEDTKRPKKSIKNYIKKKQVVSRQPNLLLNLKSNTMKNTMQKYCFFFIRANIFQKKCVL